MQLFNTQTGRVDRFTPRDGAVGMYVCGVTPYDTTHVGHAFTFLTFDILARWLRFKGIDVTYVQNVTDIDDDILRKAKEVGLTWTELGDREIAKYLKDMEDLNWIAPDHYVRATDHIPEMLEITQALLDKGNAYQSNGNVYFSVASDPEFGKLSHIPRDMMLPIANERGNTPDDPNKRDPLDFVLWQAWQEGEPSWDSPYGPGRPGWHVECSAMASRYLGPSIDIHGGGFDLVFPHHEAEIAQSENAFGVEPFARSWVHAAMVGYNGEKMSKSLGNLVLVSALRAAGVDPMAVRLAVLAHHYRSDWEWTDEGLKAAQVRLARWRAALSGVGGPEAGSTVEAVRSALAEDLDAPRALAAVDAWADTALTLGGDVEGAPGLVARAVDALLGVRL